MPAIAIHHTATDDGAWNGPEMMTRCMSGKDEAYYRRIFAWQDPEGDPKTKAAYRFVHHMVSADGTPGAASTVGCSTGIGVLNGGRGGTTIPDADREGVYRHLAAHLKDAGMEPPELKALNDGRELRDLRELRSMQVPPLEVREVGGQPMIAGYAAIFNVLSENLGFFREQIRPGAFTKTLQEADVRALWNHDVMHVLGRTKSGTLKLAEDSLGLRYEVTPPDTQWARDAVVTMKRGDVDQSSFSFEAIRDEWGGAEGGLLRMLVEVRLFDVSPVTYPAYVMTSAHVRSKVAEYIASAPVEGDHPDEAGATAARARIAVARARLVLAEL